MKQTLVEFIAQHLNTEITKEPVRTETCCAFSGATLQIGTEATPLKHVIKPATANLADTFRYASEYVSIETAKCFAESRLLRGNLYVSEKGIVAPMISGKSAKKAGRPTWVEVFRQLQGTAVLILTEESKRRLWIDAHTTETDTQMRVFLNEGATSYNLEISKTMTLDALEVVLEGLRSGFSKHAIRKSLWGQTKVVAKIGFMPTRQLEISLNAYRGTPEFKIATFIIFFIFKTPCFSLEM